MMDTQEITDTKIMLKTVAGKFSVNLFIGGIQIPNTRCFDTYPEALDEGNRIANGLRLLEGAILCKCSRCTDLVPHSKSEIYMFPSTSKPHLLCLRCLRKRKFSDNYDVAKRAVIGE